jgi:hypothetical protein
MTEEIKHWKTKRCGAGIIHEHFINNTITIKTKERDGDGDAKTVYVPAHLLRIFKQFIYLKEGIINMDRNQFRKGYYDSKIHLIQKIYRCPIYKN